jgi:hypothetical protein
MDFARGSRTLDYKKASNLRSSLKTPRATCRQSVQRPRALEIDEGVELIVAFATSVTLAAKRSTSRVPIVFVTAPARYTPRAGAIAPVDVPQSAREARRRA